MVKTRRMMKQNSEKSSKPLSDKPKKNNDFSKMKKKCRAKKLQSNIDELLKLCVPLTVRLTRCNEIPEQKST